MQSKLLSPLCVALLGMISTSAIAQSATTDVIQPGRGSFAEYRALQPHTPTPPTKQVTATPPVTPLSPIVSVPAGKTTVAPATATAIPVVSLAPPPPAAPPAPPPQFILREAEPLHVQLQRWAHDNGWKLLWYPNKSWLVLGDVQFNDATDVTAAVEEVVNIARGEGKPLFLSVSSGNRIMEVTSTDITEGEGTSDE